MEKRKIATSQKDTVHEKGNKFRYGRWGYFYTLDRTTDFMAAEEWAHSLILCKFKKRKRICLLKLSVTSSTSTYIVPASSAVTFSLFHLGNWIIILKILDPCFHHLIISHLWSGSVLYTQLSLIGLGIYERKCDEKQMLFRAVGSKITSTYLPTIHRIFGVNLIEASYKQGPI